MRECLKYGRLCVCVLGVECAHWEEVGQEDRGYR